MSKFFCDSNCELEFDKFDGLNLQLIKMPYTVDGVEYSYDLGRETDRRDFFKKMRNGASVKTQALNQFDYIEYFEPTLKSGEDIIYVTFSHAMSGTFDSMKKAIEELKTMYPERTITVADSGGISMACGLVVYHAALMHNAGATDEEVAEFVKDLRDRVGCYFTVADLIYLKRGGRLSSFKAFMGTLLNVKPILSINDEYRLDNIGTVKGRKKALHTLVDNITEDIDLTSPISILNGDCDEDVKLVTEMIKEKYPQAIIWEQLIGPVIGSHCGPDTVGVIFVRKKIA